MLQNPALANIVLKNLVQKTFGTSPLPQGFELGDPLRDFFEVGMLMVAFFSHDKNP